MKMAKSFKDTKDICLLRNDFTNKIMTILVDPKIHVGNNNIEELRNFITLHSFCYIRVFEKWRSHFTEKMTFCVHDDQSFGKSCAAHAAQSNTSTWWSSKKLPNKIASNEITMWSKLLWNRIRFLSV